MPEQLYRNIAAGGLRQEVTIEAKTATSTDTRGHPIRTWEASLIFASARVETLAGTKLEIARQQVPTATHLITIRWRQLSEKDNRINYKGRIFNIGWQNDVEERHDYLVLTCTESLSPGT